MYGYRCDEVGLKEPDHRLKCDLRKGESLPVWSSTSKLRFAAATQIGPICSMCRPVADANDSKLVAFGVMKRLFPKIVKVDIQLLTEFIQFAKLTIDQEFSCEIIDNRKTWEEWLDSRDYNESRKNQLRSAHDKYYSINQVFELRNMGTYCSGLAIDEISKISGFVKLEEYNEFKYPRNILPRSDAYKNLLGPTIEWAEHLLIQKKWVMKGIDVLEQPRILLQRFGYGTGIFYGTDFSHLEGSYASWCFELEEYFLKRVAPWALAEILLNRSVCDNIQKIKIKDVRFKIDAIRCSGEMTTSMTHTLLNYLVNKFNAVKQNANIIFIGTGDDGLIRSDKILNFDVISKLGFEFKPEFYSTVWEASFCHLLFNPENGHLYRDPREFLVAIGWTLSNFRRTTSVKVLEGLFKAKLMSFLCMYHGCPIIGPLCSHYLKYLGDIKPIIDKTSVSYWMRDVDINKCVGVLDIDISDRMYFERIFGIDVVTQQYIESAIYTSSPFQIYYPDEISRFVEQHPKSSMWKAYYNRYSYTHREVPR